jgi:hypothetical protein
VCHTENVTYDGDLGVDRLKLLRVLPLLLLDQRLSLIESLKRIDLIAGVFEGETLLVEGSCVV